MGLLDNLLRRFGYVKIARYGLTLAPNGQIIPMTALAPPPPPSPWRAPTGGGLPLPAPDPTGQTWAAPPALPFAPPAPAPQAAVPPPVPAQGSAPAPVAPAPPIQQHTEPQQEEEDDDGDWEWKIAMARAKARDDITQVIPKAGQVAQMKPAAAPPAPPRRTPRATPPPPAKAPRSYARPAGVRHHRAYPSRLPGVPTRPSDRPLASPALGDDTQVDTKRAPAASGGPLPRITSRMAKAG